MFAASTIETTNEEENYKVNLYTSMIRGGAFVSDEQRSLAVITMPPT